MDLSRIRQEYGDSSIDVESTDRSPFRQFERWFKEATEAKLLEPNAMVVATVDQQGRPTQRTVLLKYFDESGFVFFTNYNSRKAIDITNNHEVALLFPWYGLQRQVEINGTASKVSAVESAKYFALRPRGTQLGAWVSMQSSVVSNRSLLQEKLNEIKQKYADGEVPMPPAWGGFRVKPLRFEFWQGGQDRLHDRIEYLPDSASNSWQRQRLAP